MESGTHLLFTTNPVQLFLKFLRWQSTESISEKHLLLPVAGP